MAYTITNREESLTVNTDVVFIFPDGSDLAVTVSHFQPQSEQEIQQNILNRYESELLKKTLGE